MAKSKLLVMLLCLWQAITIEAKPWTWSALKASKELVEKMSRDPESLSGGSTDYGHIVHEPPLAVFNPTHPSDIARLIKFSNAQDVPFPVAARGEGHSVHGQAMARGGVVLNMSSIRYLNGDRIVVASTETTSLGDYVDVGGEQMWIDVLHATLERGLSPVSWTDYLYLTVGGTLSNAGFSGQTFRVGPQIQNVHELDVVTGKGELVTCSAEKNSELFYAVLGGLGQFGVITRARIALAPAPTRVKWLRLFYSNFSTFTEDQERLISMDPMVQNMTPSYLEGLLMMNKPPLDLSFYPEPDRTRIASLVAQNGIVYIIELAQYYDDASLATVDKEVEELVSGLRYEPGFVFEKDAAYEEFLDRVHSDELVLRSQGLWDLPHPWLNLFVPKSRMLDFNEGVFKNIILSQNDTSGSVVLVYPMNRNKWDDRMSAVIPEEDVFYIVGLLHTSGYDEVEAYQAQNQMIMQFCEEAGIQIKQYLPQNKTHLEWEQHFGQKWQVFEQRKAEYDPNHILSPGQGIFTQ